VQARAARAGGASAGGLAPIAAGGYHAGVICFSVNSGSNGNCIYVEADGVRLLFDAGISGRRTAERLALRGRSVRDVDAVIISHDHRDHVACAGVLGRKFRLPVYLSAATAAAAEWFIGRVPDQRLLRPGEALHFGGVTVQSHRTPHDGAEPVAFVVSDGRRRLGILTDLGCVFDGLAGILRGLDAVFLESNYDPELLAYGPYPPALKRRIAGDGGHLSNVEAAELVAGLKTDRLQWVALAHLSEVNNTPELALRTHRRIAGRRRPVHLAGRHEAGPLLKVQ
jgi:phosphoribosyl 1,2-cyclic phosphodiesterase